MDTIKNDLDLLDLMDDKYHICKKMICQRWNNAHNITINQTEWLILSLIYGKQPTISEITQKVSISRQAIHKYLKELHTQGLAVISNVENNNRDKCLSLTPLGEKCFLEYKIIKEEIEREIISIIGSDNVTVLKKILNKDWSLSTDCMS